MRFYPLDSAFRQLLKTSSSCPKPIEWPFTSLFLIVLFVTKTHKMAIHFGCLEEQSKWLALFILTFGPVDENPTDHSFCFSWVAVFRVIHSNFWTSYKNQQNWPIILLLLKSRSDWYYSLRPLNQLSKPINWPLIWFLFKSGCFKIISRNLKLSIFTDRRRLEI